MKIENDNRVYIKDGTQERMILDYIFEHGSITTLEAIMKLGILQSPARIWGLKKKGVNIKAERKEVIDRHGNTKHIVEYSIPKGEPVYLNRLDEGLGIKND